MGRKTFITTFKDDRGREWLGPELNCVDHDEADHWLRLLVGACAIPANTRVKGEVTALQRYDEATGMWMDMAQ